MYHFNSLLIQVLIPLKYHFNSLIIKTLIPFMYHQQTHHLSPLNKLTIYQPNKLIIYHH